MHDVTLLLADLVILLVYMASIPYGIWVWITVFQGHWKQAARRIAYLAIFFAIVLSVSKYLHAQAYVEYLRGIYDTDVALGTPIFQYQSGRALNGDGYSIAVYELPTTVRKRFVTADQRLLGLFPQRSPSRKGWHVVHWTKGPFDLKHEPYLDHTLSQYDVGQESSLVSEFKSIRSALAHAQTYYAFFANGSEPRDVDFFIVDLEQGRLYMMNHNT